MDKDKKADISKSLLKGKKVGKFGVKQTSIASAS